MRWNHTFRGGHYEYIERGEVEFSCTQLAEAGQRLHAALLHFRSKGVNDEAFLNYLDLVTKDWERLAAQHGVKSDCRGRSDRPSES